MRSVNLPDNYLDGHEDTTNPFIQINSTVRRRAAILYQPKNPSPKISFSEPCPRSVTRPSTKNLTFTIHKILTGFKKI